MQTKQQSHLPSAHGGYRPRRLVLVVGIVLTIFYSTILDFHVLAAAAAYWNIDGSFPHPGAAVAFGVLGVLGVFWYGWVLLSVWIILCCFREQLILDKSTITQHGVVRTKVLHFADVTQVIWRRNLLYESIVIRTVNQKMKICCGDFTFPERVELISFLHGAIAPEIQDSWREFAAGRPTRPPPPKRSRVTASICALLLFAFGGIFAYCSVLGWGWLAIGAAHILAGLWSAWRILKFANQPAIAGVEFVGKAIPGGRFPGLS